MDCSSVSMLPSTASVCSWMGVINSSASYTYTKPAFLPLLPLRSWTENMLQEGKTEQIKFSAQCGAKAGRSRRKPTLSGSCSACAPPP